MKNQTLYLLLVFHLTIYFNIIIDNIRLPENNVGFFIVAFLFPITLITLSLYFGWKLYKKPRIQNQATPITNQIIKFLYVILGLATMLPSIIEHIQYLDIILSSAIREGLIVAIFFVIAGIIYCLFGMNFFHINIFR